MTGAAQMLIVRVPLAVRKQRGGRKLVLTPCGMAPRGAMAADTTLVKALARAFRWRRIMEAVWYGTLNELAAAEKINSSYISRLLRLALLAPDIVEGILDGRQAEGLTLPALMEPFPIEWDQQRNRPLPPSPPPPQPPIGARGARTLQNEVIAVVVGHGADDRPSQPACSTSLVLKIGEDKAREQRLPIRCDGVRPIDAPTQRQAVHAMATPDLRNQGEGNCAARRYQIVKILVDPAASA